MIRPATPDDAPAALAIYAPIVRDTTISFELESPTVDEMRDRITATLRSLPWLVSTDSLGAIDGYAYASQHRARAAYRWSVDVTAYVHADCRRRGVGKRLYEALLVELARLGYFQAFAGIALPNAASIALHEALGFVHIGTYRGVGYKHGAWRDVGWWQRPIQPPREPTPPIAFAHTRAD